LPIVYLLHGRWDDDTSWVDAEGGDAARAVERLVSAGKIPPVILVMPYLFPAPASERSYEEARNLAASWAWRLREGVASEYRVNTRHAAIAGLSFGGRLALDLGFGVLRSREWGPEPPTAIASLSGALGLDPGLDSASDDAIEGMLERRWPELVVRDGRAWKLLYLSAGTSPHGREPLEQAELLSRALQRCRIPHVLARRPGGHDWKSWRERLPEVLTSFAEAGALR
jgi:enterochelin esterase-like enzyme